MCQNVVLEQNSSNNKSWKIWKPTEWLIRQEIFDAQNIVSKTCFFSGRERKQNP